MAKQVTGLFFGAFALVLLAGATTYAGEGGKLKWMSFDEGFAAAVKADKKVLIDVYTDWCGWCKKMDRDTYADEKVATYLSKNYVLIKLDAESDKKVKYKGDAMTERQVSGTFGVTGFPSTIFLNSSGDPITLFPGYADAKGFMNVITFIAEDHYLTKKWDEYLATRK